MPAGGSRLIITPVRKSTQDIAHRSATFETDSEGRADVDIVGLELSIAVVSPDGDEHEVELPDQLPGELTAEDDRTRQLTIRLYQR
jgi:hypothetical protein